MTGAIHFVAFQLESSRFETIYKQGTILSTTRLYPQTSKVSSELNIRAEREDHYLPRKLVPGTSRVRSQSGLFLQKTFKSSHIHICVPKGDPPFLPKTISIEDGVVS